MPELKILIAVPTGEFARRADFYDYLNSLERPSNTGFVTTHGSSPARGRNVMIHQALQDEYTHILFLDDDMAFKPDMLMRLLKHDKDIVTGLYLMRNYPHIPVIFDQKLKSGLCKFAFLDSSKQGLIEIVNCGLGACLIKTVVFKRMAQLGYAEPVDKPHKFNWITLGEGERDHWCDDISFFNRAREAGFKLYCDTDTPIGHMATMIIWPNKVDGVWSTTYDTSGIGTVTVPQIIPSDEEIQRELMIAGG